MNNLEIENVELHKRNSKLKKKVERLQTNLNNAWTAAVYTAVALAVSIYFVVHFYNLNT